MSWIANISHAVAEHGAVVRVTVIRADGSTPRETGAAMLVSAAGIADTIGGGALELEAIAHARNLLANAAAPSSPSPHTSSAWGEGRGEGRRHTPTPATVTPPPAAKASPSMQRGGRMEPHGLSSPIATLNTTADRRAKSDGVPGGGDGPHLRQTPPPDAPNELAPQGAICLQSRNKEAAPTRGASSSPLVRAEVRTSAQGEEEQAPGAPPWQRDVRDFALGPSLGQCCGGYTRLLFEVFTAGELETLEAVARVTDPDSALVLRPLDGGQPITAVSSRKDHAERPLAVARAIRDMLSGARPREAALIRGAKGSVAWFVEPLVRRTVPLFIYGAGHVGRALVRVLQDLPFAVTWADTSADRFPDLIPAHVQARAAPDLSALASAAPTGAYHIVMTYSHALDLAISHALMRRGDFGHLGLIGSATKRARFLKRLGELGIPSTTLARLTCPIGLPGGGGKEPAMIAVAVAAQLVQLAMSDRAATAADKRAAEDSRR